MSNAGGYVSTGINMSNAGGYVSTGINMSNAGRYVSIGINKYNGSKLCLMSHITRRHYRHASLGYKTLLVHAGRAQNPPVNS